MRLNRVESFYAFLLRFRSEESPCKGQPAICKGAAAAAKPPARGDHPKWQQPRGHERLWPVHKGLPPTAKPQGPAAHGATARGAAPRSGLSPARAAASRGSARTRRRRQPLRCRPKVAAPLVGAVAHADGVQRRHLCRAATAAVTQMGARRGLGHPFK
ncbi:hypothetical protein GW17_00050930 [Ensete ventricosum]|nr:hypothetical protein GW17_00050930 [Ensete ventricosum]